MGTLLARAGEGTQTECTRAGWAAVPEFLGSRDGPLRAFEPAAVRATACFRPALLWVIRGGGAGQSLGAGGAGVPVTEPTGESMGSGPALPRVPSELRHVAVSMRFSRGQAGVGGLGVCAVWLTHVSQGAPRFSLEDERASGASSGGPPGRPPSAPCRSVA